METSNKESALAFISLLMRGAIDEAYRKYVNVEGKHHNIYFPAGFATLKQAMIDDYEQNPNKTLTVKQALADGDMVAVHSHLEFKQGDPGVAVVHLFRFEEGRIVEMWDCIMPLQADSPNSDGAF